MRLAVFVDGEFWHGKKLSAERLAEMSEYWQRKIARNAARDRAANESLRGSGWRVVRIGASTLAKNLPEVVATIKTALAGRLLATIPDGVEFLAPGVGAHA